MTNARRSQLNAEQLSIEQVQVAGIYRSINAHKATNLPGSIEPGKCEARLMFMLDGQRVWRYFPKHSDAYKAKKSYRGLWRPCNQQFWNHKDLLWDDGD